VFVTGRDGTDDGVVDAQRNARPLTSHTAPVLEHRAPGRENFVLVSEPERFAYHRAAAGDAAMDELASYREGEATPTSRCGIDVAPRQLELLRDLEERRGALA